MSKKIIRISHRDSGTVIAEGPLGWGITPFEGNFYIRRTYLKTNALKINFVPGLCIYKVLCVWLELVLAKGQRSRNLGWMYWLPNPLFPFSWFRVAVPRAHPELTIEAL